MSIDNLKLEEMQPKLSTQQEYSALEAMVSDPKGKAIRLIGGIMIIATLIVMACELLGVTNHIVEMSYENGDVSNSYLIAIVVAAAALFVGMMFSNYKQPSYRQEGLARTDEFSLNQVKDQIAKAVEMGDLEAIKNVAVFLNDGVWVKPNHSQYIAYLSVASDLGCHESTMKIAEHYKGSDDQMEYEWLLKAREQRSVKAVKRLKEIEGTHECKTGGTKTSSAFIIGAVFGIAVS